MTNFLTNLARKIAPAEPGKLPDWLERLGGRPAANSNVEVAAEGEVVELFSRKALFARSLQGLRPMLFLGLGVGGLIAVHAKKPQAPIGIATEGRRFDEQFVAEFNEALQLASQIGELQTLISFYKHYGYEFLVPELEEQLNVLNAQMQTIQSGYIISGARVQAMATAGGSDSADVPADSATPNDRDERRSHEASLDVMMNRWANEMDPPSQTFVVEPPESPLSVDGNPSGVYPPIEGPVFPPMTVEIYAAIAKISRMHADQPASIAEAREAARYLADEAAKGGSVGIWVYSHAFGPDAGVSTDALAVRLAAMETLVGQEDLRLLQAVKFRVQSRFFYVGMSGAIDLVTTLNMAESKDMKTLACNIDALAMALYNSPNSPALNYLAQFTLKWLVIDRVTPISNGFVLMTDESVDMPEVVKRARQHLRTVYSNILDQRPPAEAAEIRGKIDHPSSGVFSLHEHHLGEFRIY